MSYEDELPGALLPGFGRHRFLEEGAALLKELGVFLGILPGKDLVESPAVLFLVLLCLSQPGGLSAEEQLPPVESGGRASRYQTHRLCGGPAS